MPPKLVKTAAKGYNTPVFVEDLSLENMLYGAVIRSPVARGRLLGIEVPKLPGGYTFIQAEDIPGENSLDEFSVPVLARDVLSYIGEPVALLLGPEEIRLEEFVSRCGVIADEEEAALSFDYSGTPAEGEWNTLKRSFRAGDADSAFARAKAVVEGTYATGIQEHWYSEPHGALAERLSSGALVIHTATQWPFHVKRSVEKVLKYREGPVIVKPLSIGIHLDGKIWYPSLVACHAALGTYITKKPVKLVLARAEDFRYSPKRNSTGIHIRSALGGKGEILATEVELSAGLGSYEIFANDIIDASCLGCFGIYRHGAIKIDGFAQKANLPPQGPFAGFGLAQGIFAAERHVSRIADSLRQDPAEWRKNNFLPRNSKLVPGIALKEDIPLEKLLDTAASMSDYYRKWASYEMLRIHRAGKEWDVKRDPLRGIGIALGYQMNGFLYFGSGRGNYAVETTLDKDGSLEIRTSMVSSGSEYEKIWRDIAAEILSVDPSQVRVKADTTDGVPDSGPGTLSRNIFTITKLVDRCCLSIRKQRFRDPLPITVRRASRPEKIPGWGGSVMDGSALSRPGWGAAVVEIQIDPISWKPVIRGTWLAVDGGQILSETGARQALKTGIIQALGWTCREELYYERGKIPENLVHNYDIPRPQDIPPISIDFIWNDTATSKGIGDLPFNCVPAAYIQAVSQAMDHPFEKIPLSPHDVWEVGRHFSPEKVQKTEAKS